MEIVAELNWVLRLCRSSTWVPERASHPLRKFYPWYIERLGGTRGDRAALQAALQQTDAIEHARELFAGSWHTPCRGGFRFVKPAGREPPLPVYTLPPTLQNVPWTPRTCGLFLSYLRIISTMPQDVVLTPEGPAGLQV